MAQFSYNSYKSDKLKAYEAFDSWKCVISKRQKSVKLNQNETK